MQIDSEAEVSSIVTKSIEQSKRLAIFGLAAFEGIRGKGIITVLAIQFLGLSPYSSSFLLSSLSKHTKLQTKINKKK